MGELKFTRTNNEECNTTTINIENAFIEIAKDDYNILNRRKTKLGEYTAVLQIFNVELKNKLKSWETEINEYLKNEVDTRPVDIIETRDAHSWSIYPKVSGLMWQKKEERYIKIKSVWINERNFPSVELWYVHNTT